MQEMNLQLPLIFANLNLSSNSGMGLVVRMLDSLVILFLGKDPG